MYKALSLDLEIPGSTQSRISLGDTTEKTDNQPIIDKGSFQRVTNAMKTRRHG